MRLEDAVANDLILPCPSVSVASADATARPRASAARTGGVHRSVSRRPMRRAGGRVSREGMDVSIGQCRVGRCDVQAGLRRLSQGRVSIGQCRVGRCDWSGLRRIADASLCPSVSVASADATMCRVAITKRSIGVHRSVSRRPMRLEMEHEMEAQTTVSIGQCRVGRCDTGNAFCAQRMSGCPSVSVASADATPPSQHPLWHAPVADAASAAILAGH